MPPVGFVHDDESDAVSRAADVTRKRQTKRKDLVQTDTPLFAEGGE